MMYEDIGKFFLTDECIQNQLPAGAVKGIMEVPQMICNRPCLSCLHAQKSANGVVGKGGCPAWASSTL